MKHLFAGALLAGLAACGSPQEAVVQYHRALARGDGVEALKRLSEGTRAELTRRAKEGSEATQGAVPADPAAMIVQGPVGLYQGPSIASEVTVLDRGAERTRVRATVAGVPTEIELVRESGRWHLVLPLASHPAGAP